MAWRDVRIRNESMGELTSRGFTQPKRPRNGCGMTSALETHEDFNAVSDGIAGKDIDGIARYQTICIHT
jgi:hypothetical protein